MCITIIYISVINKLCVGQIFILASLCVGKIRVEGPGGRTDRAEGRTGRKDGPGGRTGRTEGPDGRKDPPPTAQKS